MEELEASQRIPSGTRSLIRIILAIILPVLLARKNYRLHDYESQQDRAISGPHLTEPLLQREETLHLGGGDI